MSPAETPLFSSEERYTNTTIVLVLRQKNEALLAPLPFPPIIHPKANNSEKENQKWKLRTPPLKLRDIWQSERGRGGLNQGGRKCKPSVYRKGQQRPCGPILTHPDEPPDEAANT